MTSIHLRTTAAFLALCSLTVGLRLHAADAPAVDAHGDPLPRHARLRLGTERFRQGGNISALRYALDGKTLLSAGDDQVLRWWDAATGKEQRHFSGTGTLSPDGKVLASVDYDNMQNVSFIRLWDTVSGKSGLQLGAKQININYSLMAFSPDSKVLASLEQDNNNGQVGAIRLWEVSSGKELHQLKAPEPKDGQQMFTPLFFRFSHNGKCLVASGTQNNNNGTLHVWDTATSKVVFSPSDLQAPADGKPHDQAFVRGSSMSSAIESEPATALFSPDGKLLASLIMANDKEGTVHYRARLWDIAAGKQLRDFGDSTTIPASLLFDAGGRTLAIQEQGTQTVHLFDVGSGKAYEDALAKGPVQALAFAPDGKTLALGDAASQILLWDVVAGKELHVLKGLCNGQQVVAPDGSMLASPVIAFSPDGQTLAASGGALVRRWTVATGKEIVPPNGGHEGTVQAVVVTPDGKLLVSVSADATVRFWDVAAGKEIRQLKGPTSPNTEAGLTNGASAVALSADGKTLAVGWTFGEIVLWDTASGKERMRLKGKDGEGKDRDNPHDNAVSALAFSVNGKNLASAGVDGRVFWWDLAGGKMLRQFAGQPLGDDGAPPVEATSGSAALALSPDGRTLAMTSYDDQGFARLQLIELATGKQRRLFRVRADAGNAVPVPAPPRAVGLPPDVGIDQGDINSLTYAPDGKTLAWTTGSGIRLWDLVRGREVRRFGLTDGAPLSTVFSPDGKYLSAASREGTVYLWEVATGTVLGQLPGHRGGVQCVAFAPGGATLISGGTDTTLLFWDVPGFLAAERTPAGELSAAKLKDVWDRLSQEDSEQADDARQELTAAPKQAVAFLRERIKAVAPPDAKRIEQLLDELEHKAFPVRKKAEDELEKLGELAEPALRKRLDDGPGLETKTRLENLIRRLAGPVTHPERLRALRVVEVLEQIGTPEAREVLQTVAKGAPDARLTQEAQGSLNRLKLTR